MSYNQKMISVLTLLAVGITAAITFVLFEPPYSFNFWIGYSALTFSEIMFGAFWIQQIAKVDTVLPLSLGVWVINALYFVFALLATLFTGMRDSRYILLQVVGFVVFVMIHVLFRISEHHVEEMSIEDKPEETITRAEVTWR